LDALEDGESEGLLKDERIISEDLCQSLDELGESNVGMKGITSLD
jgi:hypothetical protein